ncbi:hypothetical protein P3T27_006724 [Kitasatospora sp. MAA19]|uniref:hypothetical protein n=1 Tax=unclassified Kitasatospora TaxID=2633591 RepID=UPI00247670EB|nr:hypothetical protein [Kitasatospora sp. MAA19]MDH6709975.1 hypothetical protein [Kitasatospora sp. MAA19]
MPVFPEESEIHESLPGPGVPFPRESDAQALRAPASSGATSTVPTTVAAAPVPGPRPAPPRPAPPRADRPGPPRQIPRPGPAPRRPAAAASQVETQRVAVPAAQALERADDLVDRLLDAGRNPGDILVLTVGEAHPWQQHELSFGEERYWAQLAEGGDVFYADVALTRPVHREVVVLVLNGGPAARAAEAHTKALGHATALLVVCGDPAQLPPARLTPGRA